MFRPEIESMRGYVPGEQPPPGKFIKLNTNENPYPPSPAVLRALQTVPEAVLMRYPDPSAAAFRLRAADVLGVDPDWMLCGNGSDDLLTIVTRTFVPQGAVVRFPSPSYVLYRTLAEIQGARGDAVRFEADWTLPPRFGEPVDDLRLVLLANPNSPSGTVVTQDALREFAQRLPCPLLIDEAYVEFADDDCLGLVQECDRIIVSRSMSKSYALAGVRFGYLVAQPHLIEQMNKVKDSYNCNALAILAATAAIDDQEWLRRTTDRIRSTRQRLTNALVTRGFAVQPSKANFVWCHHPELDADQLFQRLKQHHILVRFMQYDGWEPGLRISVGTDEQIDALLSIL